MDFCKTLQKAYNPEILKQGDSGRFDCICDWRDRKRIYFCGSYIVESRKDFAERVAESLKYYYRFDKDTWNKIM